MDCGKVCKLEKQDNNSSTWGDSSKCGLVSIVLNLPSFMVCSLCPRCFHKSVTR